MSSTTYRGWLTSAVVFLIVGCADATPDASLESETVVTSGQELQVEDAEPERPVTTEPAKVETVATTNDEGKPTRNEPDEEEDILAWNPDPDWMSTPAADGTPRYSAAFVDAPLLIFCKVMGGRLGQPIWIRGGIPAEESRITLTVQDKPIEELFEMALSPHRLRMQKHGESWRVVRIDEPAESDETASIANAEEQATRNESEEEDILAWNPHPDWTSTPASDGTPRYSVAFVNAPLSIFCEFMGGRLDQPIWIRGGISDETTRITLTVKDKPIEELFQMALSPHGLRMQKHGDGWRVVGIDEPADSGEHPIIFSGPRRTRTLVGESMPAITGAAVGTAELPNMRELSGKVVLVNFWATWCPPCVEALPDVNRLQQKYRDRGLIVVGVHTQRRSDKLADFLEANPVEFQVIRDDGETADRFALFALPMYVLVGRSGTVVNEYQGVLPDAAEIEAELDRTDTSSDSSGR